MTDTILLIAGAVPTTDRMIAYAVAAAERAKSKGWDVLLLGEQFPDALPYATMAGSCADPFLGDEYAMELCDKVLLLGYDERMCAMFDYLMTLYGREIWWVTFHKNGTQTTHKITEPQPEAQQLVMF